MQILDYETGMRKFTYHGNVQNMRGFDQVKVTDAKNSAQASFKNIENLYLKYVYFSGPKRQYYFKDPSSNRSMLDEFRNIITLLKQHNTEAYFFISPAHAHQHEIIRILGLWPLFEQWKREVIQILEKEYPGSNYTLWDFSGYNSITSVNVPGDRKLREYIDSTHYTPYVGDMVLARLFGKEHPSMPDDFGYRINKQSIENVLSDIREKQKSYIDTHKEDVSNINKMAADADFIPENVFIQGGQRPYGARAYRSNSTIIKKKRLDVLKDIDQGLTFNEISKNHGVSTNTIINLNNTHIITRD